MGIKSKVVFVLITQLLLTSTSCMPANAPISSPTGGVTLAENPSEITPTEAPTSPANKPDPIHLRIEFQTTSDWSDLAFLSSEDIVGYEWLDFFGDPIEYETYPEGVSIAQPIANAEKGDQVGVTFDILLDPEAIDNPQSVLLERGDLNSSTVAVYHVHNDQLVLLHEIIHDRAVLDQLGRNPHHFFIDLRSMQNPKDG